MPKGHGLVKGLGSAAGRTHIEHEVIVQDEAFCDLLGACWMRFTGVGWVVLGNFEENKLPAVSPQGFESINVPQSGLSNLCFDKPKG